jgi:hypothetical protein
MSVQCQVPGIPWHTGTVIMHTDYNSPADERQDGWHPGIHCRLPCAIELRKTKYPTALLIKSAALNADFQVPCAIICPCAWR